MSFGAWLLVLGVIFIFLLASQARANEARNAEIEKRMSDQPDFSAAQQILSADGKSGLAIDEGRMKIGLISSILDRTEVKVIPFSKLVSVELFEDESSVTKTSRGSQLGGALVGGVVFGGVGALVGGLSGSKKTTGTVKRVALRLVIDSMTNPMHEVTFQNFEIPKGGVLHDAVMLKARRWHGLCEIAIKRSSTCEAAPVQSVEAKPLQSVADELKKLAELQIAGVITHEEFQQQKTSLLKG